MRRVQASNMRYAVVTRPTTATARNSHRLLPQSGYHVRYLRVAGTTVGSDKAHKLSQHLHFQCSLASFHGAAAQSLLLVS